MKNTLRIFQENYLVAVIDFFPNACFVTGLLLGFLRSFETFTGSQMQSFLTRRLVILRVMMDANRLKLLFKKVVKIRGFQSFRSKLYVHAGELAGGVEDN